MSLSPVEFIKLNSFFFYKILESPKTNKFGLISIPHIKLHFQISNTYVKSLTDLTGKKKGPKPCSAYN